MNNNPKKAVIFAPFWRMAGHVGNNRVDRFVRWLSEDGYTVVMIRAGSSNGQRQESWGQEITVRDRMCLHRDTPPGPVTTAPSRKPNKLRRALAYWLFNPDPTVVWAREAAKHPAVLRAMEGAAFILSSSPPESAHVGAWLLSRRSGVPHIVDMRDGWLDEPLKPLLISSALRRWQEGRMEARILRAAKAIQVTSDVWQDLLCKRLPGLSSKVHVLTNGYPMHSPTPLVRASEQCDGERVLIHAGRFSGSDTRRTPDVLLGPLLKNLSLHPVKGVIRLIGLLSDDELKLIEPYKMQFCAIGWRIECPGNIARGELLKLLPQADGLLLLSASYAAIPSKLFEYIPAMCPIFVVAPKGSATWNIACCLPQATLVDLINPDQDLLFGTKNCFYERLGSLIPEEFSEMKLSEKFKKIHSSQDHNRTSQNSFVQAPSR